MELVFQLRIIFMMSIFALALIMLSFSTNVKSLGRNFPMVKLNFKKSIMRTFSSKSDSSSQTKLQSFLITPRSVDYSAWYNDVITASDLVDQSPVRGCMVIKPWGMGIWDLMHKELDIRIKGNILVLFLFLYSMIRLEFKSILYTLS